MRKLLLFTALFFFSTMNILAFSCHNMKDLEALPIQQGGRVHPLSIHAEDTFKILNGKKVLTRAQALTFYCLLHFKSLGEKNSINTQEVDTFKQYEYSVIEHIKTIDLFQNPAKKVSFDELKSKEDILRKTFFKQKENSAFKKELAKLMNRLRLFTTLENGTDWTVYEKGAWVPFATYMQNHSAEDLLKSGSEYEAAEHKTTHHLELTYFKLNLFTWAIASVLLSIFLLVLSPKNWPGLIFLALTLILEVTGIAMRVIISGRAPITNMYETVMFSGFGCLIIVSIIGHFKKEKKFLLAGLAYNLCCLLMIHFANNMLNGQISPLVPVLRDNFWLSTHVTMVILSYSAFAISWPISNWALYRRAFLKMNEAENLSYNQLIYTCLKVGTVMLSAGVILGGVWADYSWGRFWGWDPKETWSLIVILTYIMILHGRYTNWISAFNFAYFSAAAFMVVMMAWFGVNYILASGLHSYGFSEGGAIFLGSFFFTQSAFLLICFLREKRLLQA